MPFFASGVVVLCGALLEQAEHLLDKGIHAIRYLKTWDCSLLDCGFSLCDYDCLYSLLPMISVPRIADGFELAAQAFINSLAWTRSPTSLRSTWRTPATLSRMPSSSLDPRSWTSVLTRLPYCCRRWWPWPTLRPRTFLLSHICIAGGEEDLKKSKW